MFPSRTALSIEHLRRLLFLGRDEPAQKDQPRVKYRRLYQQKIFGGDGARKYDQIEMTDGRRRALSVSEAIPEGARVFRLDNLMSQSMGREKGEGLLRRDVRPRVLVLDRFDRNRSGGFCPIGYRKTDCKHPYLWVYIEDLANFRVKDAERIGFSQGLRAALGEQAKSWDSDDVEDATSPLGRYLTAISDAERAQIVSGSDALFTFATEHYPRVFELADVIESELVKLGR